MINNLFISGEEGITVEQLKCWLNDLMEGMGCSDNQEACLELLKKCGGSCARRNVLPSLMGLKEELAGISDMEKIADCIHSRTGAECIPDNDGFTLIYNRGKGCDCALVGAGYITSPLFCNCTLGFHETVWSTVFNRSVSVELLETFLRGGSCCAQKITLC